MKKKLILLLSTVMLLVLLTGCGEKGDVKELLKDYQESCIALDVEEMAECFNPNVIRPIIGFLDLFGIELSDLNEALSGMVSFADNYSEEDLAEIYQSIKITPKEYVFSDAKDACDVSAEISYTVGGETESELSIFHCEKVDDEWYIFSIK